MTRSVLTAEKFQIGAGLSGYVAELGSAFLATDLGLAPEPGEDHAAYIGSWLKVLKGDKRFIVTAAAYAQKAADFLHGFQQAASSKPSASEAA